MSPSTALIICIVRIHQQYALCLLRHNYFFVMKTFKFLWTIGQSISYENLNTYIILCAWFYVLISFMPQHHHSCEMTLVHDTEVIPTLTALTCYNFLKVILFSLGLRCFRPCFFSPKYNLGFFFVVCFRRKPASSFSVYSFRFRVICFI